MVHIRQGEMMDRSLAWERCQDPGLDHQEREREDSLEDSTSHIPVAPHLREVPPLIIVVPVTTPAPYSDSVFIAQIVRAVTKMIPYVPVPTPLVALTTKVP